MDRRRATSAPPRPKPQQPVAFACDGEPLLDLPSDSVFSFLSFLGGRDLAAASAACREFAVAARQVAASSFFSFFGDAPPPALPRLMLFRLVDRVADPGEANVRDLLGWSAMRGYAKAIRGILSRAPKWADAGAPGSGATPLTLAAEHAPTESTVELLLELGADSSRADAAGLAPAHIAARLGRNGVLAALLRYDSSAGDVITPDGRTPLMFAAAGGHEAAVALLLQAESRVNASTFVRDDHGNETALHLAAHHGHVGVAAQLLAARANPNAQMRNGRTPLILACERSGGGVLPLVRLLLTRSFFLPVDLSLTTDSGKTALYCACERGLTPVVDLLLLAGADPSQATRRNKLPLYAAAELGHVDIARLLLERAGAHAAADIFVCTTYGTTAMYVASRQTNKAMKDLLAFYANGGGGAGKAHKRAKSKTRQSTRGGDGLSGSAQPLARPEADDAPAPSAANDQPAGLERSEQAGSTALEGGAGAAGASASDASSAPGAGKPGGSSNSSLIPQSVLEAAAAAAAAERELREHRAQWQARHAARVAQAAQRDDVPLFPAPQLPDAPFLSSRRTPLPPLSGRSNDGGAAGTDDAPTEAFTVLPRGQHAPDHLLLANAAGGVVAGAPGGGSDQQTAAQNAAELPPAPPAAGNTVSEMLVRQRAAREAAAAEARARAEAIDEQHRQRAAELAVRARQRNEEKAAAEAAAAEAAEAEALRKAEAEERRKKKAAARASADFARRSAERAVKEREAMERLGLVRARAAALAHPPRLLQQQQDDATAASPVSPTGSSGGGRSALAALTTTKAKKALAPAAAAAHHVPASSGGDTSDSGRDAPRASVSARKTQSAAALTVSGVDTAAAAAAAASPLLPPLHGPKPKRTKSLAAAAAGPPTAAATAAGATQRKGGSGHDEGAAAQPLHHGTAQRAPWPRIDHPGAAAADLPFAVADAAALIHAPSPRGGVGEPQTSRRGDSEMGYEDDRSDNGLEGWDDEGSFGSGGRSTSDKWDGHAWRGAAAARQSPAERQQRAMWRSAAASDDGGSEAGTESQAGGSAKSQGRLVPHAPPPRSGSTSIDPPSRRSSAGGMPAAGVGAEASSAKPTGAAALRPPLVRRSQSYSAGEGSASGPVAATFGVTATAVASSARHPGAAGPSVKASGAFLISREARVAVTIGREPPPARIVATKSSMFEFEVPQVQLPSLPAKKSGPR